MILSRMYTIERRHTDTHGVNMKATAFRPSFPEASAPARFSRVDAMLRRKKRPYQVATSTPAHVSIHLDLLQPRPANRAGARARSRSPWTGSRQHGYVRFWIPVPNDEDPRLPQQLSTSTRTADYEDTGPASRVSGRSCPGHDIKRPSTAFAALSPTHQWTPRSSRTSWDRQP